MATNLNSLLGGGGGGGIKSIQRGVYGIPNSTYTVVVTITAVNLSKSFLSWGGCSNNAQYNSSAIAYALLTSSTTITISRQGGNNTTAVAWEVIEYE